MVSAKTCFKIVFPAAIVAVLFGMALFSRINRDGGRTSAGNLSSENLQTLFFDMGIFSPTAISYPDDLHFKNLEGNRVWLSEYNGKIVFLNFWTTWCPSCRIEMPSMERLHQKIKDEDFAILAVSLQEPASKVRNFFGKYKLSFTPLLDPKGKAGELFRVISIPTSYILDRDGSIIGKAIGSRKWDSAESVAMFKALIQQ
jgi:thiol-disulfide isomerase/thioredoxin